MIPEPMEDISSPPLAFPAALEVLKKRAGLGEGTVTSWEEVAEQTHHSKGKVLAVWRWFKDLSWDEAKIIVRDDEKLLRLRPDYVERVLETKGAAQPERNKGKPYEETLHKRQIRDSAKRLAEGIRLPSLSDSKVWNDLPIEFKPGKYSLPIGVVDISEDKQVKVEYHIDTGITTPHLLESLYSHLSTSGFPKFSELVGEKGKLESWVSEVGQYIEASLTLLKLIIAGIEGYRAKIRFRDEAKPGLTKWFLLTVWNDVIQKAGGYSWIQQSWYHPPEGISNSSLLLLRCGAYTVGIAKTKRRLKTYENWHKKLREKYAVSQAARDINERHLKLVEATAQIKQQLRQFSDMERLPGHCELCS